MRVLLATNIVLDVLLRRAPWVDAAEVVWLASEAGRLEAHITASAATDVFYIARRVAGYDRAREIIAEVLDAVTVLPVDVGVLRTAYEMGGDFEDAVQMAAAALFGLDAIVTRDQAGFRGSPVSVKGLDQLAAHLTKLTEGGAVDAAKGTVVDLMEMLRKSDEIAKEGRE